MELNKLSWVQIKKYLENNKGLIIPVGTCEQHGKHLPLCTDTIVTEYVANKVGSEMNILVAPTINYGVNLPCDRFLHGTTSISEKTLETTIAEIINWWKGQGFEKFFCLSSHGDPLHIGAISKSDSSVAVFELYQVDYNKMLGKQTSCQHACEVETSVMLYLYPELVHMESAEDFDIAFKDIKDRIEHKDSSPIEKCPGNIGYPTYATKDKGKYIVGKMISSVTEWIHETRKHS